MTMGITAKSRVLKNPDANTHYVTIPSSMTTDSQYPFEANDTVDLEVDTKQKILIVKKSSKKT
jgi:hypothetical protein